MNKDSRFLADGDYRFIYGAPEAEVRAWGKNESLPHAFKRALKDSGAADILSQMHVDVDKFPTDAMPVGFSPDWAKGLAGPDQEVNIDLMSLLTHRFAERKALDEQYEKATNRWRETPDRVKGYVPGDAGSWRWTLMAKDVMEPWDYDSDFDAVDLERRNTAAIGASYAYLGTPFFIPARRVLDVVTATPPSRSQRSEIRLPERYVSIFHDGVPVPLLAGTDDEIDIFEGSNRLTREDSLLIGGVLAANDDMTLDTEIAFMIVASPGDDGKGYGWRAVPVPLKFSSPATDVFWNYAALLAWEDWGVPAKLPQFRQTMGVRERMRKIAHSPEGERGAYHGVRVLDYRPPTLKELRAAEEAEGRPRREMKYSHKRRSYWKPRVRIGIRDENDQLVGAVYGPSAIEGETFERKGKLIPRSVVREDLPEKPKAETVYRIPGTIQRTD